MSQQALKRIDHGSGPAVILVHGSASDYRTWEQQTEALAAHFHVVQYSRRYHWPNAPIAPGAEYSMAEQVDDLERVIQSLASPRAHLIGHSYGAYLALLLAIRNPALVESLVLAEAPVIPLFTSFPPKPQEILKLLLTRPRTALPIIRFVATGLGPATSAAAKGDLAAAMEHFGKAVLGHEAFAALSPVRLEQVRLNFSKEELLSDSFMTPLDESDVRNIEARTLLVTGQRSPPFLHRLTDRLQQLMPDTRRVDIADASHIVHEDNAAAFNEAVLSFLRP